jgi:hemolysin III
MILSAPMKPLLRGWLHAVALPAAAAGGIVLVAAATSPLATATCAVFALTACLLFGSSAIYHLGTWKPQTMQALRRLDHSSIFLIIAGTYTPISTLLLPEGPGTTLLAIVWTAAFIGVAAKVIWPSGPRWLSAVSYLTVGWAALLFIPDFMATDRVTVLTLILAGGLFYTAGGIVYALRRPDPWPGWFGFHEVLHALTIGGFATHYAAVLLIVATGRG